MQHLTLQTRAQRLVGEQREQRIALTAEGPGVERNPYQHIIDIFGESSIAILLASDGEGGLKDYVSPDWSAITDATVTTDAAPMSGSFDVPAADISATSGAMQYLSGPVLDTFSVGLFVAPMTIPGLRPVLVVNRLVGYFGKLGELFIYNSSDAVGYRTPRDTADPASNDFVIFSADKAAGTMIMEAGKGKTTVMDYPSGVGNDDVRLVHYNPDGEAYTAQFWIVLNRLMTPSEIAQVRALL